MAKQKKSEVVTFKADQDLLEALQGVSNRSDFIRSALLAALENACPLCSGTGLLSPKQRDHWERFARDHSVEKCSSCNERHLVCTRKTSVGDNSVD